MRSKSFRDNGCRSAKQYLRKKPSTVELETIANVLNDLGFDEEVLIIDSYKLPESSYQDYTTAWCVAVSYPPDKSPLIVAEGDDGWVTQVTGLAQTDCKHPQEYFGNHPSASIQDYFYFVLVVEPGKSPDSSEDDSPSGSSPEKPQAPNLPPEHPLYGHWIMIVLDKAIHMELFPDGLILQYEAGKKEEGFRGTYTILSENILEFGEGTGWYPGEYQYLVTQDHLFISREDQEIEYYRQGSDQPNPTGEPEPTNVPDLPEPSPEETPSMRIFLRPSCGESYTIDEGVHLNLYYGFWGARGESLILNTATSIQIDLYLDGEKIRGHLVEEVWSMSDIPCGDYLEDSYWIFNYAQIPPLPEGEYDLDVSFTFLDEITDGYDLNEDGKLDQYGPQSSFHQKYLLIVKD